MIGLLFLLCLLQWEAKPNEFVPARRCLVFEEDSGWTCSFLLRADVIEPRLDASFPAPPVATRSAFLNWNLFGKRNISEQLRLSLDTDVYTQREWRLQNRNVLTSEVQTARNGFANVQSQTRLGLNEFFLLFEPTPACQMSVGKKRLMWGTGFASNPTDVLNPSKNLLDPTTEKRGAWLTSFDHLGDASTQSIFFAPGIVENHNTIPTKIYSFKLDSERSEEEEHYLFGLRSYHLIGEADLNLMVFNSHRYKDDINHQVKFGVSWSQSLVSLSDGLTGFGEMLAYRGTARPDSSFASRRTSRSVFFRVLAGMRYDFSNESALIVEFYSQSDGDSRLDFANRVSNLLKMRSALTQVPHSSSKPLSQQTNGSLKSVSSLNMQKYLLLNYQRYKISDDLLLSLSIVQNLHDASGYTGPTLAWSPNESMLLTLNAQSEFRFYSDAGISVPGFKNVREIDLNPFKFRVGVELKSFF
jgi:hypothetical protein